MISADVSFSPDDRFFSVCCRRSNCLHSVCWVSLNFFYLCRKPLRQTPPSLETLKLPHPLPAGKLLQCIIRVREAPLAAISCLADIFWLSSIANCQRLTQRPRSLQETLCLLTFLSVLNCLFSPVCKTTSSVDRT